MDKFPSNSHKKRLPAEPKKGDKVIQGTAKIIPKNKTKTFLKNFLAEEIHELKKDIIAEIIVPQIKDAFMQSMRLMFYGEKENRSFGGNSNRTTYSKYFGEEQKKPSKNLGRGYELAYFSVETYNDATAILHALDEIIDEYGTASVADLYDMVGISGSHTDNNYGWTDIRSASIARIQGEYTLKLPRVISLK